MPENGIKDAKTVKQFPVGQAAENQTAKNQKGTKMKKAVLFLAFLLTACDPPVQPDDVVDYPNRSNDLRYYGFQHKLIKLNDGREIECLIRDVYAGYAMDCNWNYKRNQHKER